MAGVVLTDAEIQRLIRCPKVFVNKPREASKVNKNFYQKFSVKEEATGNCFEVFISWSQKMPMDFSLGLMFGDNLLFRANGFHGTTRAGYFQTEHHAYPHTHTLTEADILAGRKAKPSHVEDVSGEYIDLFTARLYFCKYCGILGYEEYFPTSQQLTIEDL